MLSYCRLKILFLPLQRSITIKIHNVINTRYITLMRTLAIVAIGILAATAILLSCARSQDYHPDHGVPACEITQPLDSFFSALVKQNEPGMMVTIIRRDTVRYYHAFGRSRMDSMEYVSDSTIFNVADASKIFTGVAILKLIEDSVLNLDDKLSKFFPEFPTEPFSKITIRHILNHTSGLPDLRPENAAEWQQYLRKHNSVFGLDRDYRLYGDENDFIVSFMDVDTLLYEPGTQFNPDDVSYLLVAPLIEKVTGMSFPMWMRQNIFDPVGMTHTFYYVPGLRLPGMAHGYRRSDTGRPKQTFQSKDEKWDEYDYQEVDYFLTKADNGLLTTARDFRKFRLAIWDGTLISRESIETYFEPTTQTDSDNTYFGLTDYLSNANDSIKSRKSFQNSENGGFAAIVGWWPDKKVNYSIFMARNDLDRDRIIQFVDSVIISAGWLD